MRLSLRAGALLAAGSLAVHQLRYLGDAPVGGHGYLAVVSPLVAVALAIACGVWLARIGRAAAARSHGPLATWLGASASLLLVYSMQETVEGLSAAGHPGLLAHGGLVVVPIALGVGAVVALLLRGAHAADSAAAEAALPWSPRGLTAVAPEIALALLPAAPAAPRPGVLARRLAGRAPPVRS